jgi:hypothetical protein
MMDAVQAALTQRWVVTAADKSAGREYRHPSAAYPLN